MDAERQKLKRFVKMLESYRGRHTELVSVYVPADYDLIKIIQHLGQEQSTAANIKDKRTRENVITSLDKIIRHLRLFKRNPKNGIAVFAGNISDNESQIKIEVFSIEPPEPLNTRLYRCDQTFVTNILREYIEEKEVYGLIVIDRREGTIGLMKGTLITELAEFTSNVPGKTTKGGQSQARYARLREEAAHEFFKKVGAAANKEFFELKELKGILIGGPGGTKEDFIRGDYMHTHLKNKIISVQDLSYTGNFGLDELVDKSKADLVNQVLVEEKNLMLDFFTKLGKTPDKVVYGLDKTKHALELGAVEKLLISETLDDKTTDELERLANEMGTEIKMVSIDTREGEQLKELGKVAGLLRFPIY